MPSRRSGGCSGAPARTEKKSEPPGLWITGIEARAPCKTGDHPCGVCNHAPNTPQQQRTRAPIHGCPQRARTAMGGGILDGELALDLLSAPRRSVFAWRSAWARDHRVRHSFENGTQNIFSCVKMQKYHKKIILNLQK